MGSEQSAREWFLYSDLPVLYFVSFPAHRIFSRNLDHLMYRAQIVKLLRAPGIDSTEFIPCENQFRRGIDSREEGEGGPKNKVDSSIKI